MSLSSSACQTGLSSDPNSVAECCQTTPPWATPKPGPTCTSGFLGIPHQAQSVQSPSNHCRLASFGQVSGESSVHSRLTGSESGLEEISSWLELPTSACFESGDSSDSFTTRGATSLTMYRLPPTPPATPPNSSQCWPPPPASPTETSNTSSTRFECDSCKKVFGDRAHLVEHRRYRHSEDRPYSCSDCYKSFKSKSNLNQHIRTMHQKKKFDCNVSGRIIFCVAVFRQNNWLPT